MEVKSVFKIPSIGCPYGPVLGKRQISSCAALIPLQKSGTPYLPGMPAFFASSSTKISDPIIHNLFFTQPLLLLFEESWAPAQSRHLDILDEERAPSVQRSTELTPKSGQALDFFYGIAVPLGST